MKKIVLNAELLTFLGHRLDSSFSNGKDIVDFFKEKNESLIDKQHVQSSGYCGLTKRIFISHYIEVFDKQGYSILLDILNPERFVFFKEAYDTLLEDLNELLKFQKIKLVLNKSRTKIIIQDLDNVLEPAFNSYYDHEIKPKIIQEISKSEMLIWIQMAWLSDSDIIKLLLEKQSHGVEIRLILNDDDKNRQSLDSKGFKNIKFIRIIKGTMHRKIYIFDLKVVLTGSQNATFSGSVVNKENMVEISGSDITKDVKEFLKQWNK